VRSSCIQVCPAIGGRGFIYFSELYCADVGLALQHLKRFVKSVDKRVGIRLAIIRNVAPNLD